MTSFGKNLIFFGYEKSPYKTYSSIRALNVLINLFFDVRLSVGV